MSRRPDRQPRHVPDEYAAWRGDVLASLSPRQRELLDLVYGSGVRLADAASRLGMPVSAVSAAMMQAFRTIAANIESRPELGDVGVISA